MNGTLGFQEVRSSTSRSPSYRLLHEQQPQFRTGAWHLLRTQTKSVSDATRRDWNVTGRKEKREHGGIHESGVETAQQRNRTTV